MVAIDFGSVAIADNLTTNVDAKVKAVTTSSGVEMSPIPSPERKIIITTTTTWRTTDHTITHIFTMITEALVKMEPIFLLIMVKLSKETNSDSTFNQVCRNFKIFAKIYFDFRYDHFSW